MIEDPQLDALRAQIDNLDEQILALIQKRIAVVLAVGDLKRKRSLGVYDPDREGRLLSRLVEKTQAPLDHAAVTAIFQQLVTECRRLESDHMAASTDA